MVFRLVFAWLLATLTLPAVAQGWKPLQEFAWLTGKWSGSSEVQGRTGGRSMSFSVEPGVNILLMRASTFLLAVDTKPEETTQDMGFIAYDGDKRKYTATIFFSTGVWGVFDVELVPDGSVKMVSTQLVNYEAGARFRVSLLKKPDGELHNNLEVAPAGKDFAPISASKLKK